MSTKKTNRGAGDSKKGTKTPTFLSELTGEKRALLIGISYQRTSVTQVLSAASDAKLMKQWLMNYHNFKEKNITLLTDEIDDSRVTREAILRALRVFVAYARVNDSLFLYLGGHGGQKKDTVGDEHDGLDEVFIPVDYGKRYGNYEVKGILDDEIYDIVVRGLIEKCRLTVVLDACHSGTMFDLPYEYNEDGKRVVPTRDSSSEDEGFDYLVSWGSGYKPRINRAKKEIHKDILVFSACKDNQTAKGLPDYDPRTRVTSYKGELSRLFMENAKPSRELTIRSLLKQLNKHRKSFNHDQQPQLSTGYPVDLELEFRI